MKHSIVKIILITVMSLSAIGYGAYVLSRDQMEKQKNDTDSTINLRKDTPVGEINYDEPTKDQRSPATDPMPDEDTPQVASTEKPIPVVITYAGGTPLQVRVISDELLANGSCVLSLQQNGVSKYEQTVEVFPTARTTTCKGFSVDTASLPKGNYSATVRIISGDRAGQASTEVTL